MLQTKTLKKESKRRTKLNPHEKKKLKPNIVYKSMQIVILKTNRDSFYYGKQHELFSVTLSKLH